MSQLREQFTPEHDSSDQYELTTRVQYACESNNVYRNRHWLEKLPEHFEGPDLASRLIAMSNAITRGEQRIHHIAFKLGIRRESIAKLLDTVGLPRHRFKGYRPTRDPKLIAQVVELREQNLTLREIGRVMGRGHEWVNRYLHAANRPDLIGYVKTRAPAQARCWQCNSIFKPRRQSHVLCSLACVVAHQSQKLRFKHERKLAKIKLKEESEGA